MIRLLYLLHTPLCVLNCRCYSERNDLRSIRGNGLVPPFGEQLYVVVVRRRYYSGKKKPFADIAINCLYDIGLDYCLYIVLSKILPFTVFVITLARGSFDYLT